MTSSPTLTGRPVPHDAPRIDPTKTGSPSPTPVDAPPIDPVSIDAPPVDPVSVDPGSIDPVSINPVSINPVSLSRAFGYDQGQLRTAPAHLFTVAGQGSLDEHGQVLHAGDVAAQLALSMANVEAVLAAAGMGLRDVVRLTVHTTDVDATLADYGVIVERLAPAGATPPATLLGVTRLAHPDLAVEIEVTAAR